MVSQKGRSRSIANGPYPDIGDTQVRRLVDADADTIDNLAMSGEEIDAYLAGLDEPKRGTLEALRRTILEIVPNAEQGISYGMPAFRIDGKVVAGFAAFKQHCSYFPHSGSVIPEVPEASRYDTSKGTLQFAVDTPPPKQLVRQLITVRLQQLGL